MSLEVVTVMHPKSAPGLAHGQHEELVHRVASSTTFEKSPRLRAFFLHVCRCAIEYKPEEATEQQIGIYVYGRAPGYNPNEDNIVRSQARVLRMKLEHHFAHEGKDEPAVITIPKGQYLPVFEARSREQQPLSTAKVPLPVKRKTARPRWILIAAAAAIGFVAVWIAYYMLKSRHTTGAAPTSSAAAPQKVLPSALNDVAPFSARQQSAFAAEATSVLIAAGRAGPAYIDALGRRWQSDRYYEGGIVKPGPKHFFPPIADEGVFRNIREAVSDNTMVPESERSFQYNIPLRPGVYELRLYFADPLRQPDVDQSEDGQNERHFQVDVNRHPVLMDFDPVADEGFAAVDTRVFKDVYPDTDGKLHLEFRSDWGRAFVSAIELTPGKLRPIRIAAGSQKDIVDSNGVRWSADHDYIDGRTWQYQNPAEGPVVAPLYVNERDGNFGYSIPVAPGIYTLKLHFLEAFFSPLIPAAFCHGVGCRVFNVSCNGSPLLQKFDIVQAAGGPFRPVVREFHGLHPNGQGKLFISFSPTANYAEVRAIEVIDEGK